MGNNFFPAFRAIYDNVKKGARKVTDDSIVRQCSLHAE